MGSSHLWKESDIETADLGYERSSLTLVVTQYDDEELEAAPVNLESLSETRGLVTAWSDAVSLAR